jgi:hypothetical protein
MVVQGGSRFIGHACQAENGSTFFCAFESSFGDLWRRLSGAGDISYLTTCKVSSAEHMIATLIRGAARAST